MSEICKDCRNSKKCEIRDPLFAKSQIAPSDWRDCAYFSCPDGLNAAKVALTDAVRSGRFKTCNLANRGNIEVVVFGTRDKPTEKFYPRRVADRRGVIYGETSAGFKRTGQKSRVPHL